MKSKVTTAIYLDTRRKKFDETYPVKLRVTYQRERKYYGLPYSLTTKDFIRVMGERPRGELKNYSIELHDFEKRAQLVIKEIPEFGFERFERKFLRGNNQNDLFQAFREHIVLLKKRGQISTSSTYQTAMKSFQQFCKKEHLLFSQVTPKLLYDYEVYMKAVGRSVTTISMNTRCIRRLFNLAINIGDVKRDLYPFGPTDSGLYEVPQSQNIKKALSKQEIKKIFDYKSIEGSTEHFCRDLWLFSYLCNGMNMADIFRLKHKNIQSDTIIFLRHKTSHNRKIKPILVEITPPIQQIINLWGSKPEFSESYVFNILNSGLNPEKQLAKVKQATKMVNKHIKAIAKKVGINENISTYWARHSFATVLKRSGESISFISEALGHSNLATTENYMSGFDRKKRQEAAKKLIDFSDLE